MTDKKRPESDSPTMGPNVIKLIDTAQVRQKHITRNEPSPIIRVASDITPRELEPLWHPVLWVGKTTLWAGDPGVGKSVATVDVAARTTRGTAWPCEGHQRSAGDVIMLSAEDDADDTIVPRLIAAGADLERVTFLEGVRAVDESGVPREHAVSLDQHMDALRVAVSAKVGAVKLVIIDPISAFLGATDSHNNAEVRALLAALGRLASELRFAALVVSHLNKVSGANAVYRTTGSLAFVAAARAVFAIVRDPDDSDQRLMLPVKSNLGSDTAGFAYRVSVADNDAPYIKWADERVTRSADDVLSSMPTSREKAVIERRQDVQEFLRQKLAEGPQPATTIYAAAEQAGISERDLRRAKSVLGVLAEPKGFRGAWHWSLPARETRTP